ncbi:hypothetical protein SAMN05660284_00516 [Formivibrio citricus]|uniref:Alpha/beta hydrolase family protein n=1 Tax=Formivibrio citricus TaxID=83765 RepID=A0A1I4WA49_9NEIS|nr:hypothetical protein [Formivibrio citricus]SFN10307.1 hypothetical protein SAMN05660284_00516 [Formivibrio citricus]
MKNIAIRLCLAWLTMVPAWSLAGEELGTALSAKGGEPVPYVLNFKNLAPKYVLVLFPGGSGVVDPRMEDGELVYRAKGNFLLRARKFLVDDEFVTVATNSTSDTEKVQTLIDDLKKRFPQARIYFMGTSRGTYATLELADYLADKVAGEIHTASMARIDAFDARKHANRHLIVHHKDDPCWVTPFASAEAAHKKYGNDFIAMEGGISVGKACEARSHHGFNGIEQETAEAIKTWVRRDHK